MATVCTHTRSRATSARKADVSEVGVTTSFVWSGGRDSVGGSQVLATPPPQDEEVCHTVTVCVEGGGAD